MGYCTDFEIKVKGDIDFDQFHRDVEEQSDYSFEKYGKGQGMYSEESIKWYNYSEDMITISKKYPEHLIIVEGFGEENDDTWRSYFRAGRKEVIEPIITWPNSKLEEEFNADQAVNKMLTGEKV